MAGLAVGDRLDVLDDLVLDLQVALVALDLVRGDVHRCMRSVSPYLSSRSCSKWHLKQFSRGTAPSPSDDLAVALVAAEALVVDGRVVEAALVRASGAPPCGGSWRSAPDLGGVLCLLKWQRKQTRFRDRDVLALDDLRMAARAAQLLAPLQVFEVGLVVEGDLLNWTWPSSKRRSWQPGRRQLSSWISAQGLDLT